ncbi:MAG: DMT family transporter [Gluconacetobacter diazotrophicus]|nr:DMT family transporter [Gluconacetobacter diazotrophicus]
MGMVWVFPLFVVAGVLQAAGASMNGAFKQSLNNPWLASTITFGLSVLPVLALAALFPRPSPTANGIGSMPW